jgi:hypothetical protein
MNAKPLFLALLAVSVSACAQSPVLERPDPASLPPAAQGLTSQVLYQYLLGEIAGQRGELKLSAEAYADLAAKTRDVRLTRRATEVALFARIPSLAIKNASLWLELEPASPKALQTLSSLLVSAGRLDEAKPYLNSWIKNGKGGEVFMQLHGLFAKQKDRHAVLDLVTDLAAAYPGVAEARFAVGQAAVPGRPVIQGAGGSDRGAEPEARLGVRRPVQGPGSAEGRGRRRLAGFLQGISGRLPFGP